MVHSKPEYAESVKLLTFSQLRKLEKMDLKKEREAKLLELAKEGVVAAGRAAEGALSDQIVGPILVVGSLAATDPGRRFLNAAGAGLIQLAADLAKAIRAGVADLPPPPQTNFGPGGSFCLQIRAPFTGQSISEACFTSRAERDSAVIHFKSQFGSWIYGVTTTG